MAWIHHGDLLLFSKVLRTSSITIYFCLLANWTKKRLALCLLLPVLLISMLLDVDLCQAFQVNWDFKAISQSQGIISSIFLFPLLFIFLHWYRLNLFCSAGSKHKIISTVSIWSFFLTSRFSRTSSGEIETFHIFQWEAFWKPFGGFRTHYQSHYLLLQMCAIASV